MVNVTNMDMYYQNILLNTSSGFSVTTSSSPLSQVPEGCIFVNFTRSVGPRDYVHDVVLKEVREAWESIIYAVCLPLLFLINLPCNVLNIIIFFKHGIKERINLCLFWLSLADCIYVTQAFLHYPDRIYLELTNQPLTGAFNAFMLNNHLTVLYGFSWVSPLMTTIIACERCFCVVSPLRAQTVLKTQTMWVIIMVSSTFILGMFALVSTKWNMICVITPESNSTQLSLYPSRFYLSNKELIDTLDAVFFGVFVNQIFLITVIVATIITVVKLRSLTEWREKSSAAATTISSRDLVLTRMLVGTSLLYIVNFIPRTVLRITMLFVKGLSMGGAFHNLYYLMLLISTLFSLINSSFNFFIYYGLSSKFKATLKELFTCSRRE